jgi:3-hydroxyisobutyrate dehydrogenase-like beta-hydroxyacid dehydrogenase
MELGFIGLGQMGSRMAIRLLDAGYSLTVFDRDEAAMAKIVARGARRASSAAEVAAASETVLMSLPTPDVVRNVVFGPAGITDSNRTTKLVDLSTTGPRMATQIAAELDKAGRISLIDAPVSGGTNGAEKGTLAVMVSGDPQAVESLRPALSVFGKIFVCGDKPGMGQTMKLANNLLSATAMAISSEAIVMGVKAGLDPKIMIAVINSGSGRNTATQDKFPRAVLPRTFDYGFATGLMYKDVKLCLEEAEALDVPMWLGSAVRQLWQVAHAELGPASDFTQIVQCIEKWAGVEVKSDKV